MRQEALNRDQDTFSNRGLSREEEHRSSAAKEKSRRFGFLKAVVKRVPGISGGEKHSGGRKKDASKEEADLIAGTPTQIEPREILSDAHIIADVLPHNPNDRMPVITYPDIETIMRWAEHSDVKGHIYQLESGPEELYREDRRKWLYLDYYRGIKDDEGKFTKPENSTFFKAINSNGEMIAVTTVRWKDVPFVNRGRTAYRERTIVNPELRGKKIGTGLAIEVLDGIFYESEKYYAGLPASEVRSSIYTDRLAEHHDIKHNYLTLLGFKKHGDPIWVKNGVVVQYRVDEETRQVQPYRLSLADYEEARPTALEHIKKNQPIWAKHLEEVWSERRALLREKPQSLDQ